MNKDNSCPQCGAELSSWAFGGKAKRWKCGSYEHKGAGEFTGRDCFWRRIQQLEAKIERCEHDIEEVLSCPYTHLCNGCKQILRRGLELTPEECWKEINEK